MKRKIFSKLLMVALVIAAMSSFVSCKDYDDDINNLQKQIDAKAAIAQIESLQSQLTAAQTAAQKAQTDATKALADAAAAAKTAGDAATAKALEDAIAKVNAAAEKAATENAAAIKAAADAAAAAGTDAAAAKTAADEAKAAAEKAAADAQKAIKDAIDALVIPTMPDLSGYATKSEVLTEAQIKALISQNAQAKGEYLTASTLSAALADLGISASSGQVDLTPINNAIAAYKSAIDELYSIVTSVELIGTWTGGRTPGALRLNNQYNIAFIHGKQATNESFGNNEDKFFQFAEADQITYKVGDDIRTNKNLLIRVNPTNATFTKEQIQLVDSKGNDLSDIIEITDVARYTGLITRSIDNSGLWTVQIKVKDGADKAAFNTKVYNGGELNDDNEIVNGRQIVYAVAIKNDTTTTNRYVASTYDLVTRWTDYVPANYFNVAFATNSDDGTLFGRYNRWGNIWNNDERAWQDGIEGEDNVDRIFTNPELAWAVPATPAAVPTTANVAEAGNKYYNDATKSPFNDRRKNWDFIEVEVGEEITLSNINGYARRYYWDVNNIGNEAYDDSEPTTVEYYYVTLDLGNAIESRPSEFNAWKGYSIKGLNEMTHADEDLVLNIDDATAAGDYIGFRVYAVNYDGTLVDPDGRAFYVHVAGEQPEVSAVNVEFTANADGTAIAHVDMTTNTAAKEVSQTFESLTDIQNNWGGNGFDQTIYFEVDPTAAWDSYNPRNRWGNTGSVPAAGIGSDGVTPTEIIAVHYQLLKADGNVAGNWKDIASVKVSVNKPGYILDGGSLPLIYLHGETGNAAGNPTLNELYIRVTKKMPTNAGVTPIWRASLEPAADGLLTVYPWPSDATGAQGTVLWTAATTTYIGKDLTLYVNNKEEFSNWIVDAKAGVGDTKVTLNTTNGWTIVSEKAKIGNDYTSHIEYVYQNLSTTYNRVTNTWNYAQDYPLNTWTSTLTSGKVKYANAIDLFSYGLKQYAYADDATKKDNKLYVKWLEIEDGTAVTKFYGTSKTAGDYATNVNATLANLLSNTTTDANKRTAVNAGIVATADAPTYPNATPSDAVSLDPAVCVFDPALYPGGITARLSGDVTTLITVTYVADQFTIKRFINTDGSFGDVPTADKQGTITVTGKDVFGKNHTIATIPFTLLFNK